MYRACLLLLLIAAGNSHSETFLNSTAPSRAKRFAIFPKNARNGIRVNFKHNRVTPITTILAYSDGMRLQWDLPTKVSDYRKGRAIQRRDLLEVIDLVMSGHGLDGGACVMRALCEAATLPFPAAGLISKILHRIFSVPDDEIPHLGTYAENYNSSCARQFAPKCPFSLFSHRMSK
ncbi:uncharacterized protein LOC132205368 [Neocloeon triangulifer]|uniref:uncharacterized protein LOC132205368 n=1 Tax=Neocloeon triangulifer TaxID=2078957 RepID=UPI00286F50DE|nr:uncharacterized protein LOC132205368 [Neocloeon triangulifer]